MKNAKAWENADNQFRINFLDMHLIGCLGGLEFSRPITERGKTWTTN